ncbi:MAG: DEAD/DEAH box helicase family protein, partial [Bacteroidales bacterium]|nr:DEAD/DEAH box helicase family protein [Bacteroidales bacterium]
MTKQSSPGESLSPILNNTYEEPLYHYDTDMEGNLDYDSKREGRRPFSIEVNIGTTKSKKQQEEIFTGDDLYAEDDHTKFINTMRDEVKKWRNNGYPRATRITRELLNFWFNNSERYSFQKLFFCQREAVETAVYLNEIADTDPNVGRSLLRQLEKRQQSVSEDYNDILPRTAFKMATGTGKTVVMAMLILYHYINKKEYPQDTRFVDHFLIVAPGITIRDRLGVLLPDDSRDSKDYYAARHLVPDNHRHWIDGLRTVITITNYHVFEPKVFQGKKASPMDGKIGGNEGKEDFSNVLSRVLGRNMKGKRYVVINDEAHHCYLPRTNKKADEDSGVDENAKAMVWYEGLRQMKLLGYKIGHVYDLSATPYYLKGSGYEPYSLFPWVVSDFGLVDAIESGLVKIPFLPTYDNSQELTEPVLKNIYEHIRQ